MYPENDNAFNDYTIHDVQSLPNKEDKIEYSIGLGGGLGFYVPAETPVVPVVGMPARLYGRGLGYPVRGLFLDGQKVFYATEEEFHKKTMEELYGESAADWLARWDAGKHVWSYAMCPSMGPGYEQAIQVAAAELLRIMLEKNYDAEEMKLNGLKSVSCREVDRIALSRPELRDLDLSGFQLESALWLACALYSYGPVGLVEKFEAADSKDKAPKKIGVRKHWVGSMRDIKELKQKVARLESEVASLLEERDAALEELNRRRQAEI